MSTKDSETPGTPTISVTTISAVTIDLGPRASALPRQNREEPRGSASKR